MKALVYVRGLRWVDLTVGIVSVLAALWIGLLPDAVESAVVAMLAGSLLLLGVVRAAKGLFVEAFSIHVRRTNGLIGVLVVLSSASAIIVLMSDVILAVCIVAVAIVLVGFARTIVSLLETDVPGW